jgi:hypothetical protein
MPLTIPLRRELETLITKGPKVCLAWLDRAEFTYDKIAHIGVLAQGKPTAVAVNGEQPKDDLKRMAKAEQAEQLNMLQELVNTMLFSCPDGAEWEPVVARCSEIQKFFTGEKQQHRIVPFYAGAKLHVEPEDMGTIELDPNKLFGDLDLKIDKG